MSSLKWQPIIKIDNIEDADKIWSGIAYNSDNSLKNCPTSYGTLFATSYYEGYGMQFYSVSSVNGDFYLRTCNQNVWSNWISITKSYSLI